MSSHIYGSEKILWFQFIHVFFISPLNKLVARRENLYFFSKEAEGHVLYKHKQNHAKQIFSFLSSYFHFSFSWQIKQIEEWFFWNEWVRSCKDVTISKLKTSPFLNLIVALSLVDWCYLTDLYSGEQYNQSESLIRRI